VTAIFLTVAGLVSLAVGSLVVGLLLGMMIGRRSMNKHLAAAPQQFNELSAQLDAALEAAAKWQGASEKWQNASEKWQSASESWQSASNGFEETIESLREVIRLKDAELEAHRSA
jgi:SMC interacting uncharacterized protein involved in chromosome segregation